MTPTQESTPALLSGLADLTKKELSARAASAANHIAEEGGDILTLLAIASKTKHFATELEKAAKLAGYEEYAKYGREGVGKQGVRLVCKDTGTKYDYSADPIWIQLNAELNVAKAKLAKHEELLKALPDGGMGLTNPETGETYVARRPAKTSTPNIEATIL